MFFPLLAAAFVTGVLAVTLTPGLVVSEALDQDWIALPFMAVGGYGATFFVAYFNVALAATVRRSMDGEDTTLRYGLVLARERRGVIARWALLQFAVGTLTRVVARLMGDSAGERLVAAFLGVVAVVWTVSTFFVIPLLALEGLGPRDAMRRSKSLVRERWGEGLVGTAAISTAIFLAAAGPLFMLFNLASAVIDVDRTVGAGVGVVAVIALIATVTFASALSVIFRTELYRYSTGGQAAGGFAQQDMIAAFMQRPRKRPSAGEK
jgi:hypothetical protein